MIVGRSGIRNCAMLDDVALGVASGSSETATVGVGQSRTSEERVGVGDWAGCAGGATPDCSSRSLNAKEIVFTTLYGSDSQ